MTSGFGGNAKVIVDRDEIDKLIKEYKNLKKYMKSSIFAIKSMDGTEETITNLVKEYGDESINS